MLNSVGGKYIDMLTYQYIHLRELMSMYINLNIDICQSAILADLNQIVLLNDLNSVSGVVNKSGIFEFFQASDKTFFGHPRHVG
jgi:hypothetical protein